MCGSVPPLPRVFLCAIALNGGLLAGPSVAEDMRVTLLGTGSPITELTREPRDGPLLAGFDPMSFVITDQGFAAFDPDGSEIMRVE